MKNNKEILIATSNPGKVKEFEKLFKSHTLFSLRDLNIEDTIEDGSSFLEEPLNEFAKPNPKTIGPLELAAKGLYLMEKHSITCLIVSDQENNPIGVVQIYYILRAGVY